jgi:hypothetical protein
MKKIFLLISIFIIAIILISLNYKQFIAYGQQREIYDQLNNTFKINKIAEYKLKPTGPETELIYVNPKDKFGVVISRYSKNELSFSINSYKIDGLKKSLKFSENGKSYGYVFKGKNNKYYVKVHNKTYGPYEKIYQEVYECSSDTASSDTAYPNFSEDGYTFGWPFIKKNKFYIFINSFGIRKLYGPYDDIVSPDGGPLIFKNGNYSWIAKDEYGYKYIINGIRKSISSDYYHLSWSPDGTKFGYTYNSGDVYYIEIIDDKLNSKTYGPYEEIDVPHLESDVYDINLFINTSTISWAFKKDNKWFVQVNSEVYGPYERVVDINKSRNGDILAWVYVKDDKFYAWINGKTYGPYEYIYSFTYGHMCGGEIYRVKFSNKGNMFAFIFGENCKKYNKNPENEYTFCEKYYIQTPAKTYSLDTDAEKVVQGYEASSLLDILQSINFSEDGSKISWIFIKNKKYYVQMNDKVYGPYDDVSAPIYNYYSGRYVIQLSSIFSPNGRNYGWQFKKNNKEYIQINEISYGPFDSLIKNLQWSKDGRVYIFAFKKGTKSYIQVNNYTFENPGNYELIDLEGLYKNGIIYIARLKKDGKYYISVNNKITGPYDQAEFFITSDNNIYIVYLSGNRLTIEKIE